MTRRESDDSMVGVGGEHGGWSQVAAKGAVAASRKPLEKVPVRVKSAFTVLGNGAANKSKRKATNRRIASKESVAEDWEDEMERELLSEQTTEPAGQSGDHGPVGSEVNDASGEQFANVGGQEAVASQMESETALE